MYNNYENLRKRKGVSTYRVSKDTGIGNSMFSEWKKGTYTPKLDKLQKLADYFDVTLENLLNGKEEDDEQ